jgi:hypothetical protein
MSLKAAAVALFWVYIVTVVLAGLWGVVGARLDFPLLLHQEVGDLSSDGAADVLSQYRFLRGIEAGFGVLCIVMRRDIFTPGTQWNRLFLLAMGLGIAGRGVGWLLDGTPSWPMLAFMGTEAIGFACIATVTRASLTPLAAGGRGARR